MPVESFLLHQGEQSLLHDKNIENFGDHEQADEQADEQAEQNFLEFPLAFSINPCYYNNSFGTIE